MKCYHDAVNASEHTVRQVIKLIQNYGNLSVVKKTCLNSMWRKPPV
jgi:hypothetical protein